MGLPWPFLGAGLAALPKPGAWMERVKQLFALVFLAAAVLYAAQAWRLLFPTVRKAPHAEPVSWMADEAAAVIVAQKAQGPLVLDLTADWCRSCREMDGTTFADPDVAEELSRFPALLRLDCTDADSPAVRRVMELVGAPGLPFSAVLAPKPDGADAGPR
jgi:thiol:disulfide interchange protein DsbD